VGRRYTGARQAEQPLLAFYPTDCLRSKACIVAAASSISFMNTRTRRGAAAVPPSASIRSGRPFFKVLLMGGCEPPISPSIHRFRCFQNRPCRPPPRRRIARTISLWYWMPRCTVGRSSSLTHGVDWVGVERLAGCSISTPTPSISMLPRAAPDRRAPYNYGLYLPFDRGASFRCGCRRSSCVKIK